MQKLLFFELSLFALVAILTFSIVPSQSPTANVVLSTDDAGFFSPPFDIYNANDDIITLEHAQVDNETYHVNIDVNMQNGAIYKELYFFFVDGTWQKISLSSSNEWIKTSASSELEGKYDEITREDGDDLFVAAWVCKGLSDEWKCGCTDATDCDKWFVQGIDLDVEGSTDEDCIDFDGDGFGASYSPLCSFSGIDCNDNNASINPQATEIIYSGFNEDCNASTKDDDLDVDGYIQSLECDDTNQNIFPGAIETCENGIDEDCSGSDKVCAQCGEGGILTTGCLCQGQSYWGGYCCDNVYQETPCGTPEVIFYDGFESGSTNTWEYANPYALANNDWPHIGANSLDFVYQNGVLQSNQYVNTPLVKENHLFFRYYLYFEEDFVMPLNGLELSAFGSSQEEVVQSITRWQGNDKQAQFSVSFDGATTLTGHTIATSQWYCVEQELVLGSPDSFRLWIDDELVLDAQPSTNIPDEIDFLRVGGQYSDGLPSPMHVFVDDVVVSRMRVGC